MHNAARQSSGRRARHICLPHIPSPLQSKQKSHLNFTAQKAKGSILYPFSILRVNEYLILNIDSMSILTDHH
jgi:hypothetical protein